MLRCWWVLRPRIARGIVAAASVARPRLPRRVGLGMAAPAARRTVALVLVCAGGALPMLPPAPPAAAPAGLVPVARDLAAAPPGLFATLPGPLLPADLPPPSGSGPADGTLPPPPAPPVAVAEPSGTAAVAAGLLMLLRRRRPSTPPGDRNPAAGRRPAPASAPRPAPRG
jgi:hypothetical protein